jgi:hypothetical protein
MEHSVEPRELELPLELQFSMRKAELSAQEMCWEELYAALLNLYQQRLLEWCAVRALLADENIELDFLIPTDIELDELTAYCSVEEDDEDDLEYQPF